MRNLPAHSEGLRVAAEEGPAWAKVSQEGWMVRTAFTRGHDEMCYAGAEGGRMSHGCPRVRTGPVPVKVWDEQVQFSRQGKGWRACSVLPWASLITSTARRERWRKAGTRGEVGTQHPPLSLSAPRPLRLPLPVSSHPSLHLPLPAFFPLPFFSFFSFFHPFCWRG